MNSWRWLDDLAWDLRCACRVLVWRDRAFSMAAITTLALAISLNVIVFTVMQAKLFRGYPLVKANGQLLYVQEIAPSGLRGVSYPDFQEWVAEAHSFEGMLLVMSGVRVAFSDGHGRPTDLVTWKVTANSFGLLGVPPILGRDFVAADEIPGAAPVVILNYRFWESRFGKQADVVGSTVSINGAPATIVGVMPERFDYPDQLANIWMPVTRTPDLEHRGTSAGGYMAVGRLRRGATVQQARAEIETINRRLQTAFPATNRQLLVSVTDNAHFHAGPNGPVIYGSLWVGACFVLLIACTNVANLTLVRTIGRWRELSTRIALGAGPGRITRQILVEGVTVASVAGALAGWITRWGVHTWAVATASPHQILDYRVDAGTLAYLTAVSLTAALLFSVGPIARIMQLHVSGGLTSSARGVTQPLRGKRLAAGMVACQMALAIVLLSGAGVLVRSLMNIVGAESGVRNPDHVLIGSVRLPSDKYPTPDKRLSYIDRLDASLRTVPGVADVSVATTIPGKGGGSLRRFEIEGTQIPADDQPSVQFIWVGADYFRVVGASVGAGRAFNDEDQMGSPPVAIVNQSFVDRFWQPGRQSIGKRLRQISPSEPGEWRTVVGIVSNIMQGDPIRQQFKPVVYLPIRQEPLPHVYFFARTGVSAHQVARALRSEVGRTDPDVLLEEFSTLKASFAFDGDYMDLQHMELGKDAAVAPVFALVALLLAAIGLYAVIAHAVTQRTQEIGVRIAIGAAAGDIQALVLRGGMVPMVFGAIFGLPASWGVNRILQSQLVGVSPYDTATLGGTLAVLLCVALIACYIPARRAMRVDPVVALRHE